jgi:hypothetical protein
MYRPAIRVEYWVNITDVHLTKNQICFVKESLFFDWDSFGGCLRNVEFCPYKPKN